jgi:hypothetical protein
MKSIVLILLLFLFSSASGQQVDLTGTWYGTATFLNAHSQLKYEITQDKNGKISALGFIKDMKSKDSLKVSCEGNITGQQVTLKGIEVIFRTGKTCMSNMKLTYNLHDGNETLTGKWSGDMRFNTCPPLVSGNMSLVKQEINYLQTPTALEAAIPQTVEPDDEIGLTLVEELGERKYHALIIGIEDYNDERIEDLDHPIKDGTVLLDVLTSAYTFESENVIFLKNPRREDIIENLDRLSNLVQKTDNLLIFYAGHGIWNEKLNQGYWLPRDASISSKSYWLSNSTIRDYIGGINSKHTLLITDACFSGGILKERAVFDNSRAILEVYKLPSRKAMTSGTLKTVPDQSVFMRYLVKNLNTNESPLLSAEELFRNFRTAVINNSPNGQVPQYGPITQSGDEGGDFIFLRRQ